MRGRPLLPAKETGKPMLVCALEHASKWDVRLVKTLLDKGANPSATERVALSDGIGMVTFADTPLLLAIEDREEFSDTTNKPHLLLARTLVAMLLQYGANPNQGDFTYMPLQEANDLPIVKMLLDHGAKVSACEGMQNPLLNYWRNTSVSTTLVEHGADVNAADAGGVTPLMATAFHGDIDRVHLLIRHGAKANFRTQSGTALMNAASGARVDTMRLLLAHGADPNSTDAEGKTALMEAAETGDAASVRILLQAGADVNVRNNDKTTALQEARAEHHTKVCLVLRAAGAH